MGQAGDFLRGVDEEVYIPAWHSFRDFLQQTIVAVQKSFPGILDNNQIHVTAARPFPSRQGAKQNRPHDAMTPEDGTQRIGQTAEFGRQGGHIHTCTTRCSTPAVTMACASDNAFKPSSPVTETCATPVTAARKACNSARRGSFLRTT